MTAAARLIGDQVDNRLFVSIFEATQRTVGSISMFVCSRHLRLRVTDMKLHNSI